MKSKGYIEYLCKNRIILSLQKLMELNPRIKSYSIIGKDKFNNNFGLTITRKTKLDKYEKGI